MALPKQVRQQIAEAQRIEGALKAAKAAETPPPPADDPTPPEPANPPTEPQQPQQPPEPQQPQQPPQPQTDPQHYAELLQQYRSLQGIHRAMVRSNGELQSQVQTLQAQIQGVNEEIERMRQQPATPSNTSVITDAEIKEYGPELISVIERKAQQVAAPLNDALTKALKAVDQLTARNTELEQSLKSVTQGQANNAGQIFEARLRQLVPDFNELNYDNRFLSWLSQVDPLDAQRRTLQQRLDEAVSSGDAETVASFFNTFKQLTVAAPAAPAKKTNLAAQAQPASRSAPDNLPPPSGRMWTQAEISEFYADVARGKYGPTEKSRIEKEIFAAQKDKRIAA